MKTEKSQKSEKKAAATSQRGRKTKETERNFRGKKEENPLHKRLKSDGDGNKRKTRRTFFTEQNDNKPRSSRERNVEDKERKTVRSRRDDDRREPSSRRRFEDDDRRASSPRRRFEDDDRRASSSRRRFEDDDRRTSSSRRRFEDDDRRASSSRRRFEDDDRRASSSRRRFEDDDRRASSPRRRFEENDDFSNRSSSRSRKSENRFDDKPASQDFEKRSYKRRNSENSSYRFEEESNKRKPYQRRTGMESEIVRDIVRKRRATGRSSDKKPKVLSLSWNEDRGLIRLNKYIANSGICSRREADDLIIAGTVTVNGKIVTELGAKIMPSDEVRYEDKILQREKPIYILLNKPKDYITTTEDDRGRDNVMMLIEGACEQRVYPVGRLDRNTTGLLLFTNDGEMTKKMTHPRFGIKKIYQVELDKELKQEDFETLKNGIELEDGFMQPDELEYVDGKTVLGITLHSGKNRIVRRLFGHLGYEVEKLDRVYYAGLTKKNLSRGEWRILRQEEINMLKMSI